MSRCKAVGFVPTRRKQHAHRSAQPREQRANFWVAGICTVVPQCCKHCSLGVTAPQSRCGSALVMVRHDEGQFISPGRGKALSAARNVPFRHPVGPSPSFRMDFPENGNATPALRCESRIAAIMVAIANIFLWIYEISNLDPCRSAQNRDVWDAKGGLMRLGWSLARSACGRWPTRSRAQPSGRSESGWLEPEGSLHLDADLRLWQWRESAPHGTSPATARSCAESGTGHAKAQLRPTRLARMANRCR